MSSLMRLQGRFGQRILLLTTAAVLLTGLLRRDSYAVRTRRLLARRDDVAVVMVDQDHFEALNDGFGHPAGDAVLAATVARLTAWAGPRAAVGRLGVEFAVVVQAPAAHTTLPYINGRGRAA